jgi:hypothetical protein
MIKIQIEASPELLEVLQTFAKFIRERVEGEDVTVEDEKPSPPPKSAPKSKEAAPKKGPGRPPKKKDDDIGEGEDDSGTGDGVDDEPTDAGLEDDIGGEEDSATEDETISVAEQASLKDDLQKYAAKHSREAAAKILNKFARTRALVKKSDLPKLKKALKV